MQGQVVISCTLLSLMSFSPRSFVDCALGRRGLLDWFRRVYFHSIVRFGFGFQKVLELLNGFLQQVVVVGNLGFVGGLGGFGRI